MYENYQNRTRIFWRTPFFFLTLIGNRGKPCAACFSNSHKSKERISYWVHLVFSYDIFIHFAKFSWFFFRLISKSMVLELQETGKLHAENMRKGRFTEFMTQLYFLVGLLATESQNHTRTSLALARNLNSNLAHFLSDILGILPKKDWERWT